MDKYISIGWIFLLTAMAGDLLVSFILSLFYKGYSNLKMSISALGNPSSPVRIPFNIWMFVEGALFIAALPAVFSAFYPVSAGITVTMMVFIGIFAVGSCIFTSFFSVNETKEIVTAASRIHGAGSVTGFMLFHFVPLFTAILSFRSSDLTTGVISAFCFALSLVFFTLFVLSDKPEFKDTKLDNEGLWQRLDLLSMYLPLAFVAVRMLI